MVPHNSKKGYYCANEGMLPPSPSGPIIYILLSGGCAVVISGSGSSIYLLPLRDNICFGRASPCDRRVHIVWQDEPTVFFFFSFRIYIVNRPSHNK